MRAVDRQDGLLVAGTLLPRLELLDVRVLRREHLSLEGGDTSTIVVWPDGDRGRPDDVCWIGVGRPNGTELGSSALPPLPAIEFSGGALERLERAGRLDTVLQGEGLVRALRYDICLHDEAGRLERLLWSVRPAARGFAPPCAGRRHTLRSSVRT